MDKPKVEGRVAFQLAGTRLRALLTIDEANLAKVSSALVRRRFAEKSFYANCPHVCDCRANRGRIHPSSRMNTARIFMSLPLPAAEGPAIRAGSPLAFGRARCLGEPSDRHRIQFAAPPLRRSRRLTRQVRYAVRRPVPVCPPESGRTLAAARLARPGARAPQERSGAPRAH